MLDSTQPIPLDYQLPVDAYWHLIRTLHLILPPPPTDSAEDLLRRDHAAIARIAAFAPGDAAEADVAAEYVAASEHWKDCLRLVREPNVTPEWAMKCRAQAVSMMRQANSALRELRRMQAERRKLEAARNACQRRDWTDHCATAAMAGALRDFHPATSGAFAGTQQSQLASDAPVQPVMAGLDPAISEPHGIGGSSPAMTADVSAPDEPARRPQRAAAPQPEPAEELAPDPVAEAELYAALYPERAALIRRLGRVPHDATFGPPDDEIVAALTAGRTPALLALEQTVAERRAA